MVSIDKLLRNNTVDPKSKYNGDYQSCFLCNTGDARGLFLNNGSLLCESCLRKLSQITYPEIYERSYRKYLIECQAYEESYSDFKRKNSFYHDKGYLAWFYVIFPILILPFINLIFIVIPLVIICGMMLIYLYKEKKARDWREKHESWKRSFTKPERPQLRNFHDPEASLTETDKKILKVFDLWPGYPPYWDYLRDVVLSRDGNRCQVTGCPSRTELHIHHKTPKSNGGEHIPENLVTLCSFHHALEPDAGHEFIWNSISNRFFSFVEEHDRLNQVNIGYHTVRSHYRRRKLATADEVDEIIRYYGMTCPNCKSDSICSQIDDKLIYICCNNCDLDWTIRRRLTEEVGPSLASIFTPTKNIGTWESNSELLEIRKTSFHPHKRNKKKAKKNNTSRPLCPICGSKMNLKKPQSGQSWSSFWGCTKYPRCKGSRKYKAR